MLEKDKNVFAKLLIEDVVVLDDTMWFCAYNYNSLYSMNLLTKEVHLCGIFPGESYSQNRLFASMELVEKKIYFIPCTAKSILIYDIETKEFSAIEIGTAIIEGCNEGYFYGCRRYKHYIYMFPARANEIVRLDTRNNEIVCCADWHEQSKDVVYNEWDIFFEKQNILINNKVFAPFCNANAVLELDCETMEVSIHVLGEEKDGYVGICYDGTHIWLAPKKSRNLVKWDMRSDVVCETEMFETVRVVGYCPYIGLVHYDNSVLACPIEGNGQGVYANKNVRVLEGQYTFVKEDEIYITYYDRNTAVLTLIDKEKGYQTDLEIVVSVSDVDMDGLFEGMRTEQNGLGAELLLGMVTGDYSILSRL